jgi:GT2 family glycosyltransferase
MISAPVAPAVVIPSWNSADLLPACIDSVLTQDTGAELMVVDNGSSDGSVAFLEDKGIPHITLPRNVGFAAAVNMGVARTVASSILVLNADTVLEPGSLGRLVATLSGDPGLGGVQPLLLQLEGQARDAAAARVYSACQALTRDGRAVELGAGEPQSPRLLRAREVFGVCGAACLLRRELFEELGGYDESYVSFYEDVDLNVRGQIRGWRFALEPEAVVWHVGNASWTAGFARARAENARLVARNRLSTQLKFMPPASIPRILIVEIAALARAAREHRLVATLRGKLEGLRRLRPLLAERRNLAARGDLRKARRWLGSSDYRSG